MKMSHGLLSIALLVSVAQLNADCDSGSCRKDDKTAKRGCCEGRTVKCDEGCVKDEDGNCVCEEKCGCNKPNKSEDKEDGEEVLVCEDCEEEVTDEGKCGCNKPNKKRNVQEEEKEEVCVGCGEEKTEKGCGCSSSCGCSSCCK